MGGGAPWRPAAQDQLLCERAGGAVRVRSVCIGDREGLQGYFQSLSLQSRYNRFLGVISRLPDAEMQRVLDPNSRDRLALVITTLMDGVDAIIGEGRCALDRDEVASAELGLSIADGWQCGGLGRALLAHLERCARGLGADRVYGDIWSTNRRMIGLARDAGYAGIRAPAGWTITRMQKLTATTGFGLPAPPPSPR